MFVLFLPADDTTGIKSIYTVYQGHELMFHVSTMLPYSKENKQQVGGLMCICVSSCCRVFIFSKGMAVITLSQNWIEWFRHSWSLEDEPHSLYHRQQVKACTYPVKHLCKDIHGPKRKNPIALGGPLTFSQVPPWVLRIWFWGKVSATIRGIALRFGSDIHVLPRMYCNNVWSKCQKRTF